MGNFNKLGVEVLILVLMEYGLGDSSNLDEDAKQVLS